MINLLAIKNKQVRLHTNCKVFMKEDLPGCSLLTEKKWGNYLFFHFHSHTPARLSIFWFFLLFSSYFLFFDNNGYWSEEGKE